jgi:protein PhnA
MMKSLESRSKGKCELCSATASHNFIVAPKSGKSVDHCIHTCEICQQQLTGEKEMDSNHWRCLNDSMWSEVDAVKVVVYRTLHGLKSEGWPNDLLDMMYLNDETSKWAMEGLMQSDQAKHVDSNGVELIGGDSVVLIKDLKVKGGNFTAKRGTAVRNIRLVHDNPEHIEGKVEGQTIVILTQYVKK